MLIGKSDRMTTALGRDECAQRLQAARRSFLRGSRADSSGFRVARGAQTAIRMRGTFIAQPNGGTLVTYRIEFLPAAVVSLAISIPVGLVVLGLVFFLAHQSLVVLLWFVPFAAVVGAANLWVSDIQARRLVSFVRRQLDAS